MKGMDALFSASKEVAARLNWVAGAKAEADPARIAAATNFMVKTLFLTLRFGNREPSKLYVGLRA